MRLVMVVKSLWWRLAGAWWLSGAPANMLDLIRSSEFLHHESRRTTCWWLSGTMITACRGASCLLDGAGVVSPRWMCNGVAVAKRFKIQLGAPSFCSPMEVGGFRDLCKW